MLGCKASYIILIGRHTINDVGVVVSTPHLKVKFPLLDGQIATIRVNQELAKLCYSESLTKYGHWGEKDVKGGHRCVEMAAHIDHEPASHDFVLDPRDDFKKDTR